MEILHISPSYKPASVYGGPTMSVSKLCETLTIAGVSNVMLTTTANGSNTLSVKTNEPVIVDGVMVYYYKRIVKDPVHLSFALLWHLTFRHLRKRPVVVHIHSWWNLTALCSCTIALWYNFPVIVSPKGMLTAYTFKNRNTAFKNFIHLFLGKHLLKRCHVQASTEQEKIDVLAIVKPLTISVIPNLIKLPKKLQKISQNIHSHNLSTVFSSLQNHVKAGNQDLKFLKVKSFKCLEVETIKLLFLSRIEEKKGLDTLFHALQHVNFNWKLSIAGNGNEKYIRQLKTTVRRLNLAGVIEWIGHVNDHEKFKVLKIHDLVILPSHNESFGNVVIESLSVGTPVVISCHVGLAPYVIKKQLGWIFNSTIEDLTLKLVTAIQQMKKRLAIRMNAPAIIAVDYADQSIIQEYVNLYNQTINFEQS
jgi:glycosyltransferase involved in cell wall biosynthesis